MTKCTSQRLLETGHKAMTMQKGHITLNIAKRLLRGACVYAVRCLSGYRSILCVINAELTVLLAGLVAPPPA